MIAYRREASKVIANYFDYCRVKEYIHMGLDTNIIDPDKGANIARKLERLRVSGLNEKDHPNLRLSPAIPIEGWTSNLADLPPVSFATLYTHFVERLTRAILDDSNMSAEESAKCESEDDECLPSFRGLGKGYRFFKDGHVHSIQHHPTHDSPGFCFVRVQVLPSMVKSRKYSVQICLTSGGNVHTPYCVCPAGLAGCCNHVAALLYALEEFVRLGLREESKLPCTSRLQQWNRPRCRNVPPRRVVDVAAVKEEYGKQKRRKLAQPLYDPRPLNLRLPRPEEQETLLLALQRENEDQLNSDTTGNVAKYGSSCLLRLMEHSSSEGNPCTSDDGDDDDDDDIDGLCESDLHIMDASNPMACTSSTSTPDQFYDRNVVVTSAGAAALEQDTRGQSENNTWFLARRVRVTASIAKDIAARQKKDFTPLIRHHLSCQFKGNMATLYGKQFEKVALDCLVRSLEATSSGVKVMESGLVVNSSEPWLGASPDGIVIVDGVKHLVEIKCPYAAREMVIEEAVSNVKPFCLSRENDKLTLKRSHKYFYQVQVQLHVCRLTNCFFVVWTQKDFFSTSICVDRPFLETVIPKLRSYYFQELLPALSIDSIV